jgi:hypothetical protein
MTTVSFFGVTDRVPIHIPPMGIENVDVTNNIALAKAINARATTNGKPPLNTTVGDRPTNLEAKSVEFLQLAHV